MRNSYTGIYIKSELESCNQNIVEVLKLSRNLIELANKGDSERKDKSCGVLFGMARDAGYKLEQMAIEELDLHRSNGCCDDELDSRI